MPRSLPAALALRAALRERRPFRGRHATVHHLLELAGIENELGRRRVGHRRRRHEIDAADGVRTHAELTRRRVDQALKQIAGFGPPRATIGADRHGVGAHALDVDVDRRGRIDARHEIRRARRHEGAEWREIGAEIGDDRDAQAEEAAVVVKRKLGARDVIAALVVGDEALGAVLLPLHRPFQLAAGPDHQRLLGIDEGLHAEPAADVGRDQAELVLRNLENDFGERVADEMRTLRRGVKSRAAAGRIVIADGVARLHRVDDDAVVDEFERDDVRGLGEGGVGCLGVARVIVPIEHDVAGNVVEKLRRAGRHRILRLGDRGQRLVFDLDRLGGIARRRKVSATTRATGSPTCRTLSSASTGRGVSCRGLPSRPTSGVVQGISPRPSVRTSSPVSTSSTPGMRRAAAASTRLMRACAMGERSTKACVIRGSVMSSV